jgi:diacylglycerol kinase family enzyme
VSSDQDVCIEADGEVLGTGPFEIEIVPAVLTVVVSEN